MRIDAAAGTHPGQARQNNEDSMLVRSAPDGRAGVFVVADGVGGRTRGEIASRMLVDEVGRRIEPLMERFRRYRVDVDRQHREDLLGRLASVVDEVGRAIYERAQADQDLQGMCTTGVAMVVVDHGAFFAHVGDSRAYLVRAGEIRQLTEDHTLLNRFMKDRLLTQADLASFPFGHVLTRSLGASPHVDIDTLFVQVQPGDRVILCTDGLYNHLSAADLGALSAAGADPHALVEQLIATANQRGGTDNITAVVLAVSGDAEPLAGVDFRLKIELLRGMFLFRGLDDQQLMRVLRVVYSQRCQPGEVIIREGDAANEIYILVDGEAEVTLGGELLATVHSGGHFGELSLIDDQLRSATVTARTAVTLLSIRRDDFARLVRDDHSLAVKLLWAFLGTMAARLRELSTDYRDRGRQLYSFRSFAG